MFYQKRSLDLLLFLQRMNPAWAVLIVAVSLFLVSILDYLTGPDVSLSLFYYVCVGLAGVMLGLFPGLVVAVLASLLWTFIAVASGRSYHSNFALAWSVVIRLANFALLVLILNKLQKAIAELRVLSIKDPLTHASNRRHLEEYLERTLKVAHRHGHSLTVAYFDIDNFKSINDKEGHEGGDQILKTLVEVLQSQIRPEDMLARLGGDEFFLVLPQISYEKAQNVLARLLDRVRRSFELRSNPVTLSVGACSFESPPADITALFEKSDSLMYKVKRNGKASLLHLKD